MKNFMPDGELFVDTGSTSASAFFVRDIYPYVSSWSCPSRMKKKRESYIHFMGDFFSTLLKEMQPRRVWLEEPEFWSGSAKSQMAIAQDNLFDLQACCITYADRCAVARVPFRLVKARKWKGTLSKDATIARVKRIDKSANYGNEHIWDAVAFGMSMNKDVWNLRIPGYKGVIDAGL